VVVDLAAGDRRGPLVQQVDQRADQPGLALPALAQQHDVVAGEQGALQLRQDGVVEADDAGEALPATAQECQQVVPDLVLDGLVAVPGGPQGAQGGGGRRGVADHARPLFRWC
jgi:hypothetical protein